jgi:hypothetical protein
MTLYKTVFPHVTWLMRDTDNSVEIFILLLQSSTPGNQQDQVTKKS